MVDQEWATENIELIMKWWKKLNKSQHTSNRSKDKKNMLVDIDTIRYRGYYYLAKEDERKRIEKTKTIGENKRIEEDIRRRTIFADTLEEQLIFLREQIRAKDKQIASLEKLIESRLSPEGANQI